MDKFKENLAFAFPHARTQQMARQAKNRLAQPKLNLTFSPASGMIVPTQLSLFDNINESLGDADSALKTAIDYTPKDSE